MADKRAYFKLDVGYLMNPKVAAVSLESATAVLLHIGSIAYAAQHLTDGIVPIALLLRLTGASKDDAEKLLAIGLWEQVDERTVYVHDYAEHQRSAEQVKRAEEAGKAGAVARWDAHRSADGNANRMRTAVGAASEVAMPREKREKEKNTTTATPAATAEFEAFWAVYPKRADKGHARAAYVKALKKTDAETLTLGAKRYAASVTGTDPKFIALPTTWLNGERWEDDATPAAATGTHTWSPWDQAPVGGAR